MVCLVLYISQPKFHAAFSTKYTKTIILETICNKPANKLDKFKVLWAILAQAVNNL